MYNVYMLRKRGFMATLWKPFEKIFYILSFLDSTSTLPVYRVNGFNITISPRREFSNLAIYRFTCDKINTVHNK